MPDRWIAIPVGKKLWFYTGGQMGYYLMDDGIDFAIYDHDNHELFSLNYARTPTIQGDVALATATPPQEFDLPLAEDFANGGGGNSIYWKDQFNQVHFCICVSTPQISTATGVVVATLPEGFRPSKTLVYDCASSEGVTRRSGSFNVYPNGTISYFGDILPAGALLFGSGVFVAAG